MERTRWPGIYRRGESWVAVVGYSSRGKRRQKWLTATNMREAQRARRDFLDSLSKGIRPEDATMTVADLSEIWLTDLEDLGRRSGTLTRYRKALRLAILPAFGTVKLKDLDRDELRRFERSHNYEFQVLSAMLGWAVKDRSILAANPCSAIRRTRRKKVEPAHLDAPEAHRMLEAIRGNRLEGGVVLGLVGGLRLSEACGVRWGDLEGETLYVRRQYDGGSPKGDKPRSLTLPADTLERLRRYKVRQAEDLLRFGVAQDQSTAIVTTWSGLAMNPYTLAAHFRTFCGERGFKISFHGLRHSCAIGMLSSGVDVKTAASRLGHSPRVLLATYAHHVKSADEAAAERLGQWLSR